MPFVLSDSNSLSAHADDTVKNTIKIAMNLTGTNPPPNAYGSMPAEPQTNALEKLSSAAYCRHVPIGTGCVTLAT